MFRACSLQATAALCHSQLCSHTMELITNICCHVVSKTCTITLHEITSQTAVSSYRYVSWLYKLKAEKWMSCKTIAKVKSIWNSPTKSTCGELCPLLYDVRPRCIKHNIKHKHTTIIAELQQNIKSRW